MSTIILGLGNPLWGDDSVGPRVISTLRNRLHQTGVTLSEASISGLDILELLADYDKAIIIDAIETGNGTPGTIYRLELDDIAINDIVTPHDIDFITALKLGRKLGLTLPASITIFAIEVGQISPQEDCTPQVRAAIPLCADMTISELETKARQAINS